MHFPFQVEDVGQHPGLLQQWSWLFVPLVVQYGHPGSVE